MGRYKLIRGTRGIQIQKWDNDERKWILHRAFNLWMVLTANKELDELKGNTRAWE